MRVPFQVIAFLFLLKYYNIGFYGRTIYGRPAQDSSARVDVLLQIRGSLAGLFSYHETFKRYHQEETSSRETLFKKVQFALD